MPDEWRDLSGCGRTGTEWQINLIKRFMDVLVLPKMTDEHAKERTVDELPQSASGKSIMTTEPKFVPKEAAEIQLAKDVSVLVRLIDCVGYMVEGAAGHMEKWSRTSGENAVERKRNSVYKGGRNRDEKGNP